MKAYIDANIFVYLVFKDPERAKKCEEFIHQVEKGAIEALASVLTLAEVEHVVARRLGKEKAFRAVEALLSLPITYIDMDLAMFGGALLKTRDTRLKMFDAIHLTTALAAGVDSFYSYDRDFEGLIKRVEP